MFYLIGFAIISVSFGSSLAMLSTNALTEKLRTRPRWLQFVLDVGAFAAMVFAVPVLFAFGADQLETRVSGIALIYIAWMPAVVVVLANTFLVGIRLKRGSLIKYGKSEFFSFLTLGAFLTAIIGRLFLDLWSH